MIKTITRTLTALAASLLILTTASLATAEPTTVEVERVTTLLNAYDIPPTAAMYKSAASDPRATLLAIYRDEGKVTRLRHNALTALAHFPSADVRGLYTSIIAGQAGATKANRVVHHAIQGVMFAFGEDAIGDVLPMLVHADVQVRLTAVHALSQHGGAKGRAAIRAHASKETNAVVKEEIARLGYELR